MEPSTNFRTFSSIQSLEKAVSIAFEKNIDLPHLLLADLKLPDGNFLDALDQNQNQTLNRLPFVVITGIDEEDTLRRSFELGAEDVLVKPFSIKELSVKIERILERRSLPDDQRDPWKIGSAILCPLQLRMIDKASGKSIVLTSKEFQILAKLSNSFDQKNTRSEIVESVWGDSAQVSRGTLDVHINSLRKKLKKLSPGSESKSGSTIEIKFIPPDSFKIAVDEHLGPPN